MKVIYAVLVSTLAFSCSSNDNKSEVIRKESHKTTIEAPKVEVNRLLTAEISGMTCVMGCGASIRKELRATNAVSTVEFDFKEDRKFNTAEIAFDKDKITVDEIVSILSKMNDKQFTVGKTSSKEYADKKSSSTECTKSDCEKSCDKAEESSVELSSNTMESPNFLSIITHYFVF